MAARGAPRRRPRVRRAPCGGGRACPTTALAHAPPQVPALVEEFRAGARSAPSPRCREPWSASGSRRRRAGSLHVGSARTALFNWLFARHHGGGVPAAHRGHRPSPGAARSGSTGSRTRCVGSASTGTRRPVLQSPPLRASTSRPPIGSSRPGDAYECYCTEDEVLDAERRRRRRAASARRATTAAAATSPPTSASPLAAEGRPRTIRFRTPDDGAEHVRRRRAGRGDGSSGRRSRLRRSFAPTAPRSSSSPTRSTISTMGITHVIRGEDLIDTTHRVLAIRARAERRTRSRRTPICR